MLTYIANLTYLTDTSFRKKIKSIGLVDRNNASSVVLKASPQDITETGYVQNKMFFITKCTNNAMPSYACYFITCPSMLSFHSSKKHWSRLQTFTILCC